MARRRLNRGEHSNIAVRGYVEDGKKASGATKYRGALEDEEPTIWRATCRYRAKNGYTKQAEVWRSTAAAAEADLRSRVTSLTTSDVPAAGKAITVTFAARQWLEKFAAGVSQGKVRQQTVDQYQRGVEVYIIPALGGFEMAELTTGDIAAALDEIAGGALSNARMCRIVLTHITKYAKQRNWITTDVMGGVDTYRLPTKAVQVLTLEEIAEVRQAVKAWQSGNSYGPPRGRNLLDILDLMLGTGCRPGEALALRWEDVDLGDHPTVTIAGTVVYHKGKGHSRQEFTKTAAGYRTLPIAPSVANMLVERTTEPVDGDGTLVFPGRGGVLQSVHNFRRMLREALKQAGLEHFHSYLLRKRNATTVADSVGIEAAAANLGHSSPTVTRKHYAGRAVVAPDVSESVEKMFTELSEIPNRGETVGT